jgi:hypothetical protein
MARTWNPAFNTLSALNTASSACISSSWLNTTLLASSG